MFVTDRQLEWDGCFNVRDLGGLVTRDGRTVRRGAVVRGDAADGLSAAGWEALLDHGVRTVIDLRDREEHEPDAAPRPRAITTVELPLDGSEDRAFWDAWITSPAFGTPLYYGAHLDRFPQRSARVLTAIANAAPGGVLLHCSRGRDRTGQMAMLLLDLLGVAPEAIAADYALSIPAMATLSAHRGERDQTPGLEAHLTAQGTTAAAVIATTLADRDLPALLAAGGLTGADRTALHARLLDDPAA